MSRRALVILAGLWLVLGIGTTGCGGGGGGGGPTQPPPPPPPPPPGITFTPSSTGGANSISLASSSATTANRLVLEVRANQVTDLYGVAFDLSYPTALLRFDGRIQGSFLDGTLAISESPAGNLVVGVTRLGSVPGASGSGVLVTLEFAAVGAGTGAFSFSRNSALDSDGDPLSGTGWAAGSVQVVR